MDIDWTKVDALSGGLKKSELFNEALFSLGASYSYDGVPIPPLPPHAIHPPITADFALDG